MQIAENRSTQDTGVNGTASDLPQLGTRDAASQQNPWQSTILSLITISVCVMVVIFFIVLPLSIEAKRQAEAQRARDAQREQEARREQEKRDRKGQEQEARRQEREQEARQEEQARTKREPQKWWEILGVAPTANMDTIRRAYRSKIQQYHPDRLNGLAPELVRIAEGKTKELNQAFDQAKRSCATASS
jgi:flagellar biosynthesis GTPase FlhF